MLELCSRGFPADAICVPASSELRRSAFPEVGDQALGERLAGAIGSGRETQLLMAFRLLVFALASLAFVFSGMVAHSKILESVKRRV
eukprot:2180640-Alexandrium_andersonii.AAC.1